MFSKNLIVLYCILKHWQLINALKLFTKRAIRGAGVEAYFEGSVFLLLGFYSICTLFKRVAGIRDTIIISSRFSVFREVSRTISEFREVISESPLQVLTLAIIQFSYSIGTGVSFLVYCSYKNKIKILKYIIFV